MSQVKVTNKKSGITYVYESESYWDKEKKQPRNTKLYSNSNNRLLICLANIFYQKNFYMAIGRPTYIEKKW